MSWVRRSNTRFIRIAMALLVLAALAPTVSRMLGHMQHVSSPWSIVCSAPSAGGDLSGDTAQASTEHCPMCLVQVPGWHTATDWSLWSRLPAAAALLPLLFLWAPRPLFAWAAAQPRAPPALA